MMTQNNYISVDECINTGMKVIVYNGHLDLIVDTPGECIELHCHD